ncbi:hypothetical protein GW943_00770 [Candidatus Parcubacteria bacterium]|uniref:Primosomal protein N' 3' DNA-binding domain-containing protein n=1 Tax=Candidatus Kaiserbacteria bacterium CG10_big_fil_rev_8_21_14_0_10_47_16 TaxID=1974608 RepID=A0A2H0UD98_9BACT|nr:hypothetical protein [Candidatus Parcubacteria bacterium]PIR84372.1 MAG: hypothetical protein COU16_02155 [Candidatus Kaiserbacteria bacterium CG10_big_fil_rev_8_21_14_0_10_47_16]
MFVIEVIPLKRSVQIESLSYFSSVAYTRGTIITIPVRNQQIRGVVVETKPVSGAKTALRAATFSLRKLPAQENTDTLSPIYIETAAELAEYYACHIGSIIYQLLPPEIRDGNIPLPHTHHTNAHTAVAPEVLQGTSPERFLAYRALVRETFAHAGSVLLVTPSSVEAAAAYEELSAGIEDRVVLLTSTMTTKSARAAYTLLDDFSKPKLIIATPAHSVIERHDITTVIIDSARSGNYRERVRPYLDTRTVLTLHAKKSGRRLIFADLLPRTEEEIKRREDVYGTIGETPKRIILPGKVSIVKMNDKPDGATPFKLFSPKVLSAIEATCAEKGKVFLFAARRGLSPVVACIDCGHIFRCPESGAPYSLVRLTIGGEEKRFFVCGVSGKRERAADVCPECGGWRLRERGIGIQHVYDELSSLLPGHPIVMFDHTTANTFKKASFLAEKFYKTKGAILIGTPMVLPYLIKGITTSVIVNMDALRATPTWRQQEETLGTLLHIREHTTETVYIQTRTDTDELLEQARTGSVEKFYDDEIALREGLQYPPYAHFIHLTWQGTRDAVEKTEQLVSTLLESYKPMLYSAPPSPKGALIRYALIRVGQSSWPNKKMADALRALPPTVRVFIDPDRIV